MGCTHATMAAVVSRSVARSEQRVDERCDGGRREEDQQAEQEHHEQDRQHPPFLVLAEELEELADERGLIGGNSFKVVGWRFVHRADSHRDGGFDDQYWRRYDAGSTGVVLGTKYESTPGRGFRCRASRPIRRKSAASGVNKP